MAVEMLLEISGKNNLRPIWFLEFGLQRAAAVAHIAVLGRGSGTGLLIGRDVLLTNNHVIDSQATARNAVIRFNYQDGLNETRLEPRRVDCAPEGGFFTSPYLDDIVDGDHLDFIVVRLAEPVGDDFGAIPLAASIPVEAPMDVFIIQHPDGQKKKIAIADNVLEWTNAFKCHYRADTRPGSSGAPVFNDNWDLIALHHAEHERKPGDPRSSVENEGIRIGAIVQNLPDWARA